MPQDYEHLDRDALIRLLQRRDAERQLGLVWERDEIEAERALNDDYVALALDAGLGHGEPPWRIDIESWIKQQSAGKPERAACGTSNKGDRK